MLSNFIAICSEDAVAAVVKELETYGAENVKAGYKAVSFDADQETSYRLHLKLQTPSRLLQVIRRGSGSSIPVLTNQARKVKWNEFFRSDTTYLVEGVAGDRGPGHPTATDISKAIRMGLEDFFRHKELDVPRVDLKEPKIKVVAHVHGGELTLSLDSTGKSMHKRGYRMENHPAPVKENMAAALLILAGYDGTQPFYDPMCGSGTIAIEASFMSLNKAALIHRRKGEFAFENFATFDHHLWRRVQEETRGAKRDEPLARIFASDIESKYVDASRENALRARVEKHITFYQGSFFNLDAPASSGLLLSNLPYGERIGQSDETHLIEFYKRVGDTLKQKYSGWKAALLVGADTPYKF
ncbi:MAG: THUMP domain-containing protein, partial [Bdellovibrionota bacterium]